MEDLGHVQLREPAHGGPGVRIVQLTDLHQWPAGDKTWTARGRVIDFEAEGYSSERNVDLAAHVLDTAKPDLVILTGDILDGRPCESMPAESFRQVMQQVVAPIVSRDIPWAFVPGNHDDDHSPWARQDLVQILTMPGCIQSAATGFDHTLTVGFSEAPSEDASVRLWLFDSGGNSDDEQVRYTTFSPAAVEGYRALSRSADLAPSAVGLAYFHIPLPEYEGVAPLVGKNGLFDAAVSGGKVPFPFGHRPFSWLVKMLSKDLIAGCSRLNSGLFDAFVEHGNVRAMFVGHDHHCDWIGKRQGVYLGYGRCGGFTPPHDWEGAGGSLPFDHGARVVEVAPGGKARTWVCTFNNEAEDEFELVAESQE